MRGFAVWMIVGLVLACGSLATASVPVPEVVPGCRFHVAGSPTLPSVDGAKFNFCDPPLPGWEGENL
jgi:hypothetical protein